MVPGWCFLNGVILQGRQIPSVLPVIGQSCLGRKGGVTWASIHAPIQRNSMYVHTVRQYIYETRQPGHPNSTIRQYEKMPPWTPSSAPLHITSSFHSRFPLHLHFGYDLVPQVGWEQVFHTASDVLEVSFEYLYSFFDQIYMVHSRWY